ncbi:hypothetical protein BpHYR1_044518 [Brachionus plicatilis]|uniref:Uncharacterized protein n=1 Tax=Brachionus plicatilis TaxID=10195 RepID=A0A3M7SZ95_BRAPC|nr:hypothetical protein BpHYR1_044518 [Brachionus plicatilis]
MNFDEKCEFLILFILIKLVKNHQLTFYFHAGTETLLPSARLTPVSHSLVHNAPIRSETSVLDIFSNRPLKKSLASLARHNAIVSTGGLVSAYYAK